MVNFESIPHHRELNRLKDQRQMIKLMGFFFIIEGCDTMKPERTGESFEYQSVQLGTGSHPVFTSSSW